jgi:ankyrin repeat protein
MMLVQLLQCLHRYGRYNSCRQLLNSPWAAKIINEPDGSGLTALHAAAEQGHVKVVQLLLQNGAGIFKLVGKVNFH